jgi:putative addiction module component (TIGR02574 family)
MNMKARLDEVTKDALALPVDDQEVLAEKLVGNLVARVPAELKKRQLAEVMRRRADILGGKVPGIQAAQVVREIQALFE